MRLSCIVLRLNSHSRGKFGVSTRTYNSELTSRRRTRENDDRIRGKVRSVTRTAFFSAEVRLGVRATITDRKSMIKYVHSRFGLIVSQCWFTRAEIEESALIHFEPTNYCHVLTNLEPLNWLRAFHVTLGPSFRAFLDGVWVGT